MRRTRPVVTSMRLPADSSNRLKRVANRLGWTQSDTSARLIEEGLRRTEFAYIDCRDSAVGRQAYKGRRAPCLSQAATQGLTLVTYARRTIPLLLKTGEKKNERTVG
jgi:hypothetical protein